LQASGLELKPLGNILKYLVYFHTHSEKWSYAVCPPKPIKLRDIKQWRKTTKHGYRFRGRNEDYWKKESKNFVAPIETSLILEER